MPSAVNVLNLTPKISPKIWWDIFQINFNENDEKTWYKRSHGDFASIWEAFTCWLSKRVLKRRFLERALSKFFTICKFGNTLALTINIWFKRFKIWCRFQKWNKKFRKTFSFYRKLHLNWELEILTLLNRILPIRSQCLTNTPKISPNAGGDIFAINFPDNDEQTW